ncbi:MULTISPECIES: non-ribosomal peptide synthetase [unclassified Moorena]|uniref:non-ribosomal peptide synthetase n=1 Tax=unclassified Moorena TaxID=2683338 RepID=UPI0013C6146D|nr:MULTISPECIES: non-ribosomal peptide synthetase [unclassified Moorena]NEO23277.1 amino acid adenylation domain-containing protein [Moorena sp. SIO4A5]NEQ59059.1 amino acid adenylation domain-containing protein [Moorena sp. SIO4A1]
MSDINQRIAKLSPAKRKLLEHQLKQNLKNTNYQPTITPRENPQSIPLSFSEERMWILDRLEPGNPAYNRPTNIRLTGSLNVEALERAINEIVGRHEVFRTSFIAVDGQPIQAIASSLTVKLLIIELSHLPSNEREIEVERIAVEETQQRFDLSKLPLIQAKLLRLSEEENILLLTIHHIIFDGWSAGVLLKELAVNYEAFATGKSSPLPPLPIQYADFAIWQRQRLQGEKLESQLAYWKKQLGGSLPVLELPTDRPRRPVQTFQGAKQNLLLPQNLSNSLKELSLRAGVTLFMTLLAAFQILLYRYTGEEDIIVGTPIAGRDRIEIEQLIGVFINTLVLRTQLNGNFTFSELLAQVREVALGAYAHQDIPFEKLVEELQPERDLSHTPIFQVLFQLRNLPSEVVEVQGLKFQDFQFDRGITQFDLTLDIVDRTEGLCCVFEYNRDLFDGSTIERMAGHFQTLLSGIVANQEQRISQLPLLSEAERHQLLVEWNNTATDYPQDKCIHQLFEEQVELTPDAVAVVFEDKQLTYRQLNNRANQLAHYLRSKGVGPEVLVGICVERSVEMLAGLLGILKAGGAYVPLDPNYPQQRLAYMLSDSNLKILLTQQHLIKQLPVHKAQTIYLDKNLQQFAEQSQDNPYSEVTSENLAYIIYTSGSTGKPKGTMIVHSGMVNYLNWCTKAYNVAEFEGCPVNSSIGFDATITSLFSPLFVGAKVVLLPEQEEIEALKKALCSDTKFSLVKITPSHLEILSNLLAQEQVEIKTQAFILGGEALSEKHTLFWQQYAPTIRLINEYGPTETVVGCCIYEVKKNTLYHRKNIPIGRPIYNTKLYILDKYLQPVTIGVIGELYIGGAGVARGYLNRPELTSERFITNPFGNSKLYKTGDLARYLPDGNIEFLGRIDNQVKIRGFRIELSEIEATLIQHPEIQEAVVIVREVLPGDKRLVAYVVSPGENIDILTTKLRGFLKQKLPQYMIPNAFVVLDALPLTPNGKVDRRGLPAPDTSRQLGAETFVAPRDSTELQLAQIWSQVLGIQPIGVTDNFFELGGHSLLAVRLVAEIEKVTQTKLPLAALFQFTTIEEIASLLKEREVADNANPNLSPELLPLDTDDLRALLTIVAGREGARPRPDSLMVTIRPTGVKPPLFYCANGVGEISTLARYLGEEQPVYFLESGYVVIGKKGQKTEANVKAIAASHVRDILEVYPTGPILLTGYSFGKNVAYEVAKQLQERGKKVAFLAILDTWGSGQMYRYYLQRIEPALVAMKKELLRGSLVSCAWQLGSLLWEVKDNLTIQKSMSAVGANQGEYLIQGYSGKITLFLTRVARDHRHHIKIRRWLFPLRAWEEHVVDLIRVPGDHLSMRTEPHVRVLAEKLKMCIDQALAAEADRE